MSMFKKLTAAALAVFAAASFAVGANSIAADSSLTASADSYYSVGAVDITSGKFELGNTRYPYSGQAINAGTRVTIGGKKLTRGTDYTVTYLNNVNVGTASVYIKGRGSYTGTKKLTFQIVPPAPNTILYSSTTSAVTLRWTRVGYCTGYKIYRYNASTKSWTGLAYLKSKYYYTYTDKNLRANTSYIYKVMPVYQGAYVEYRSYGKNITTKTKYGNTPVNVNGQLSVSGANIVNQMGQKFQIRGMSTHGINWEDFRYILSYNSLKVLRDDWGVNTVRIAMYTEEWGGYTTGSEHKTNAINRVNAGVSNATSLGMYAVIDWHILSDGNPQTHQAEAIQFFSYMANRYKNYNNVIYEICNEPNGGVTWNGNIKSYATAVEKAIRTYDSDAIIIVGTGTWSQDIDQVVNSRLSDTNTVYALHFYANTHTDWLRNRFTSCYNSGLPILVSEFGTCDASGNGGYNEYQTKQWLSLLDSKGVGYINWSASNKAETASAFLPGTNLYSISAGTSQLTESGKLVRSWYRARAGK